MRKKITSILLVLTLVISAFALTGCNEDKRFDKKTVIVASKDYNENVLLGEIVSQVIEAKTDYTVERKLMLGGTSVCFSGLKNKQIDIYVEFTGTAYTELLNIEELEKDPDKCYDVVQKQFNEKYNIKWLEPLGFNNTYAIALKQSKIDELGITKASELKDFASQLKFGGEHEFFNRADGYDGMIDLYDLNFKEGVKLDYSLKYTSIVDGTTDVTDAFTTDAEVEKFGLGILEDDLNFFPPYYAAPIVRETALEKLPELETAINMLAGKINEDKMRKLNYKKTFDKVSTEKVAEDFLKEIGIIA